MSGKRRSWPADVQDQVLVATRRRCCLCYFLDGIKHQRKGQLSHIGQDPSRSTFDDAVWLCLEHHDQYDSSTSQSKGLRQGEVRDYRDKLYEELEATGVEPASLTSPDAVKSVGQSGGITAKEVTVNIGPSDESAGGSDLPVIAWPNRAGAPQFRMNPGVHEGRLLCGIRISDASPAPGGVEARWLGAGTNMDWIAPIRGADQEYEMKPADMTPTPPADEVTLEVRFNLEDGPHGGRWTWPMQQHEKGHWILNSHLGSGVHQPSLDDAW